MVTLGTQAGISIAGADPAIAATQVRKPIRGRMRVEEALRRLLDGTGLRAVKVTASLYRVERSPADPSATSLPMPDVIVTANKLATPLNDYPGSVNILTSKNLAIVPGVAADTRTIVNALPTLSTTSLGPGREKLFLRGIADSSFAGASQATVGQYLGEVQLNYSAPDPALLLYDVEKVEVLEGPQGTLYGVGTLGGVVRVVPSPPKLSKTEGEIEGSLATVAHGGRGGDAAAMLNLPIRDNLALRVVAYRSRTPGYIDDIGRGLRDINAGTVAGGRVTTRWRPNANWAVDVGGVYQRVRNEDAQYTDVDQNTLTRSSAIAQPSTNNFVMGFVTATHDYGDGKSLTITASGLQNQLAAQFDATQPGDDAPNGVTTDVRSRVFNGEIRFARGLLNGTGFVVGAYATFSDDQVVNSIISQDMMPGQRLFVRSINNKIKDIALYGEASVALADRLVATAGLRATYISFSGINTLPSTDQPLSVDVPGSGSLALLPTAAINWKPGSAFAIHLTYRRGSRPGGYALTSLPYADGSSNLTFDDFYVFAPDKIDLVEAGVQVGRPGGVFYASAALSAARWRNIQSDMYGYAGPYTVNIGNGEVYGAEATITWRPRPTTILSAAVFAARSRLSDPDPDLAASFIQELPNTPGLTAKIAIDQLWRLRNGDQIRGLLNARYQGRSYLGLGPLYIPQGDFATVDASLSWIVGRRTISVAVSNILDSKGNRFALGDPLSPSPTTERVPVTPRTIRLSFSYGFN